MDESEFKPWGFDIAPGHIYLLLFFSHPHFISLRHTKAHTQSQTQLGSTEVLEAGKLYSQVSLLGKLSWGRLGSEVWSRTSGAVMPAQRLVQTSRWEGMNLIQSRSSKDSEEGVDPRDAEDIESTWKVQRRLGKGDWKFGCVFKPCIFVNQVGSVRWCSSLKLGSSCVKSLEDEFSFGPVCIESSMQYPDGFIYRTCRTATQKKYLG